MPPQETGETFNSWFGKSHLEMHWWHAAHFALWNRTAMLERSLPWYSKILPVARATARRQGYRGARWPKMIGPEGRESPSGIGVFLIWQQPHPIYFAELVYRADPSPRVLQKYREIVFATAEFMASYPFWDQATKRYVLGPPLIPAQESHPPKTTFNPTFELAYWAFGLEAAQRWRERLGLAREPTWDRVIRSLSPMPMRDGLYVNAESARSSHVARRVWLRAVEPSGSRGDAAHAAARDGELAVAGDVGVGLSSRRHDRVARRRADDRDRRTAHGHAEEPLPPQRPQLSAARTHDLLAR
jgi:hypothetical protein